MKKNWKLLYTQNIQSGHRDGIWHRKMCHASNEKRETTPYGWNGTTKRKHTNIWAS